MHKCGYCQSENSTYLYPTNDIMGNDYDMHHCPTCKAVFLSPYPDAATLAQAYDESYYGEGDEKFNDGLIEKILDRFRILRAKRIAKLINNQGRVLDIGCGNGRFLQMIMSHGDIQGHGIEMESNSAKRAKTILGDNLQIGTLKDGDYPDNHFDAITLFHVFEHLTDPQDYLKTIQKILKPGGILYMSFPNIDSWQSRLFKGNWLHLDPPRHLFFFGPADFKKAMNDNGFEVIDDMYLNPEYNPFGFQQSLLNTLLDKRDVLYEGLKGNDVYTKPYLGWKMTLQKLFFIGSAPLFVLTDILASIFKKSGTVEFTMRKVK